VPITPTRMRLFAPWTLARATRVVNANPEAAVKKVRRSIMGKSPLRDTS